MNQKTIPQHWYCWGILSFVGRRTQAGSAGARMLSGRLAEQGNVAADRREYGLCHRAGHFRCLFLNLFFFWRFHCSFFGSSIIGRTQDCACMLGNILGVKTTTFVKQGLQRLLRLQRLPKCGIGGYNCYAGRKLRSHVVDIVIWS